MAKSTFEVGEKEKHLVSVDWDRVMKRIQIDLDGQKVVDEMHYSPGAKKFPLDVGSSEKHKVEVSVGMFSPMKVLVDGKPAKRSDAHA